MTNPAAEQPRLVLDPIGVWTNALDFVPLAESVNLALEIEELGYGALWLPEVAGREVFVQLGAVLAATKRLVGATGIASIWARDAVTMTSALNTLTEGFPERMILGLGVSHHTLVRDLRGHDYSKPLAAMRSYLTSMQSAPFSATRPTTPTRKVLAALGPKMVDLAGEMTDGVHNYFVPPEHTAQVRDALGTKALVCPEQMVLLETDPIRAREIARLAMAAYIRLPNYQNNLFRLGFSADELENGGSDRLVDAIVAWGTIDSVIDRVRAHFDAGADHVSIQVVSDKKRFVPVNEWRLLAPGLKELASNYR